MSVAVPDDPAEHFLQLWIEAEAWSSSERVAAISPRPEFLKELDDCLNRRSAADVMRGLWVLCLTGAPGSAEYRGQILSIMRTIDETFLAIHPRARTVPGHLDKRHLTPWLKDFRDQRQMTGFYATFKGRLLVPRGPLARPPRESWAAGAEALADSFTALSATSLAHHHERRPLGIELRVIGSAAAQGVPASATPGKERIAGLPIMQKAEDLHIREWMVDPQRYAAFSPATTCDPAERLLTALERACRNPAEASDIAIAPEFSQTAASITTLARELPKRNIPFRLLVAGSGATSTEHEGLPWNEACVFNRAGAVLWRQRKIWPAGIDQRRAKAWRLQDPGSGRIVEANASGHTVVIADLDGLGRCLTLICQDVLMQPVVAELIREYQPDWVFVPVLDEGADVGRWGHQQVFALSAASRARYLIVSSTALAARAGRTDRVPCLLAVGPRDGAGNEESRQYNAQAADGDTAYARVHWHSEGWQKTRVG